MTSPFSGRAGRLASIWNADYLQGQQNAIDDRIRQGQANALGAINAGQKQTLATLGKGYSDAGRSYQPYAATGLNAFNQYADASGVNGQAGYDRAAGNFRASPGYQWSVDQASDVEARKASALGMLGSGNTATAISDRAQHMADQEYNSYLDRLSGLGQMGYNAAGQQAGLATGLANARAGILDGNARARAGIYQTGTGLGVSTLQNTTGQIANAVQGGMMAGQAAAANRWGALMNGVQLGTGLLGNAFGGGTLGTLGGLGSPRRGLTGTNSGTGQFEWPQDYGS